MGVVEKVAEVDRNEGESVVVMLVQLLVMVQIGLEFVWVGMLKLVLLVELGLMLGEWSVEHVEE